MYKVYSVYNLAGQRLASFPTVLRAALWMQVTQNHAYEAMYRKVRIKRLYILREDDRDDLPLTVVWGYRLKRDIPVITENINTGEVERAYLNLREFQDEHHVSYVRALEYFDGKLFHNLRVIRCSYEEALYEIFYEGKGLPKYDATRVKEEAK